MKKLFEPVDLKGFSIKNRLVRSATWEGIADPDGSITEEAYEIYRELAAGGAGSLITVVTGPFTEILGIPAENIYIKSEHCRFAHP